MNSNRTNCVKFVSQNKKKGSLGPNPYHETRKIRIKI